ncbi:FeoA family protein [Calderihabitans maritimus]|uniref:FeoA family protein n=1 Tax=Calderihabitans maritimus TaxID=1246530 RepID=UPI000B50270B|nr:FeoA family protein [Calderihabitans maritimus]
MSTKFNLSHLPIGQAAVVHSIKCTGSIRRRLLDLGLVPGTKVVAVRRSPAGDPTAFLIRGALVALRKEEAEQVGVTFPIENKEVI